MQVAVSALPGEGGGYTMQLVDVTGRRIAERRLTELALHDALTGLPNRRLLTEQVEAALARTTAHGTHVGVLFIDLDDFKAINDTAGHAVGDQVLTVVARRLSGLLRPGDTVARIGGDEFVLLAGDLTTPEQSTGMLERVQAALSRPVVLNGVAFRIGASIGLRLATGAADVEELIRDADTAMYAAKSAGKGQTVGFLDEHRSHNQRQAVLRGELKRALALGEFRLYVQPVVDIR